MTPAAPTRAEWLNQMLSTAPADRPRAEAAVRALYRAANFPEPRHVVWFDSPFDATWAMAPVLRDGYRLWNLPSISRDDRQRLEEGRSTLGTRLGLTDPNQIRAAVGAARISTLLPFPDPRYLFSSALLEARYKIVDNISALFIVHGDDDDLARAETHFWGGNKGALVSALHCPTTYSLIGSSFFSEYSFSSMADDEHRVGNREPSPLLHAAWETARSTGLWWPFEHVAFLSERPTEVHVNDRQLLHRSDGPAAAFRDGRRVYAWNGKAVPEQWILHPEAVPAREYKGFDPTFGQYVKSKSGPAQKTKKSAKPASLFKTALPADHAARLDQLRKHAGGTLPRFDRYQAGAYAEVWQELVSLGSAVREDPHAADALAVAYETMRRVNANVRTLVERLTAMGYTFSNNPGDSPHVAPAADIQKQILAFEKEFGALPLSLRAFYEVVGPVNLIGSHATIDPKHGTVATDPLLVYGLDEGLVEYDEDEDSRPSALTIAPDDLHKANTSGGAPYEMAIPDLRADGELVNERHHLLFVDYLRLCFRFGGFPGYDGVENVPAEIASLSRGLIPF